MNAIKVSLLALFIPALASAEPITCHFPDESGKRTLATTLQGEAGQEPSWLAQTLVLRSNLGTQGTGMWVGVAEEYPEARLAEISVSVFRWNGQPGLGISVAAAPVLNAVSFGMMREVAGSAKAIAPEPVWGMLKVDGRPVMSQPMTPRSYPGGTFLEMNAGFLNRPDSNVQYGVDAAAGAALQALLSAGFTVSLELHQITEDPAKPPVAGQQPLATFSYLSAEFPSAQAWANEALNAARTAFATGCPDNLANP